MGRVPLLINFADILSWLSFVIFETTCTNKYLIKLIYQNPTVNMGNQACIHVQKPTIKPLWRFTGHEHYRVLFV